MHFPFQQVFAGCPKLRKLSLSNCMVKAGALVPLSKAPGLTSIVLERCSGKGMTGLSKLRQLKDVELTYFQDLDTDFIAGCIGVLTGLTRLHLKAFEKGDATRAINDLDLLPLVSPPPFHRPHGPPLQKSPFVRRRPS